MRLHPREAVVREARQRTLKAFVDSGAEYPPGYEDIIDDVIERARAAFDLSDCTEGEVLGIIAGQMATTARYAIRYERHGDTDTPGGLA